MRVLTNKRRAIFVKYSYSRLQLIFPNTRGTLTRVREGLKARFSARTENGERSGDSSTPQLFTRHRSTANQNHCSRLDWFLVRLRRRFPPPPPPARVVEPRSALHYIPMYYVYVYVYVYSTPVLFLVHRASVVVVVTVRLSIHALRPSWAGSKYPVY